MSKKRYRPEEIIAKLWEADDRMEGEVGRRLCCHISADLRGERLNKMQTPRKQLGFWGRKGGFAGGLLTRDFLYSMMTCLSDAPLA